MTTVTMTRECNVCGEEKDITEFPKNGKDKEGNTAYRPDCKTCYNITRKTNQKKVRKFLNNTKHRTGEVGTYTVHDWKEALLHFKGACAYCRTKPLNRSKKSKLTKEHVVPVIDGGLTVRRNIIPACTSCNSSKSNSKLEEWYPKQKFYTAESMEAIKRWTST